jgi:hypothetical protein
MGRLLSENDLHDEIATLRNDISKFFKCIIPRNGLARVGTYKG